jgi:DNA invertase Pin-like site-specific DNA recombinase
LVREIPITIQPKSVNPFGSAGKLKVAAYARVSTDTEEQLTSYNAQVEYYTNYIKSNPNWELVEMYADEGITGTKMKNRDNFLRMVADAKAGKIHMILVKSISRFARNLGVCGVSFETHT